MKIGLRLSLPPFLSHKFGKKKFLNKFMESSFNCERTQMTGINLPNVNKKRKELTLEEKVKIIEENKEKGNSERILASKYHVSKTQVHRILAHKAEILRLYSEATFQVPLLKSSDPIACGIKLTPSSKRLKAHSSEFDDVNCETWEWYKEMKDNGNYLTGPMIQNKAKEIAIRLGKGEKFKASNGWLEGAKKRFRSLYEHGTQLREQQGQYSTSSERPQVPVFVQIEEPSSQSMVDLVRNDKFRPIDLYTAIDYIKKLKYFSEVNQNYVLLSVFNFAEETLEKQKLEKESFQRKSCLRSSNTQI